MIGILLVSSIANHSRSDCIGALLHDWSNSATGRRPRNLVSWWLNNFDLISINVIIWWELMTSLSSPPPPLSPPSSWIIMKFCREIFGEPRQDISHLKTTTDSSHRQSATPRCSELMSADTRHWHQQSTLTNNVHNWRNYMYAHVCKYYQAILERRTDCLMMGHTARQHSLLLRQWPH